MFKSNTTLECAIALYEPSELILIGTSVEKWIEIAKELNIVAVHYIDADEKQIAKIASLHTLPKNWKVYNALLWSESKELSFYKLSNPALNGTLSSEILSKLWKNLTTKEIKKYNSIMLDDLIKVKVIKENTSWLVIDCFDVLAILEGSKNILEKVEAIVARTVIDDVFQPDNTKRELDKWMGKKGYKHIALFEENHPKVGMSLYVKDYKSLVVQLNSTNQEKQKESETLISQLESGKQTKTIEIEKQKDNESLSSQLDKRTYELKNMRVNYEDLETRQSLKENMFEYELKNVTNQLKLIKKVL